MKKILLFISVFLVFVSNIIAADFKSDSLYSKWIIDSRMGDFRNKSTTVQFKTATTTRANATWDYVPGLVAKAILMTWEHYKDSTWSSYMFNGIQDYADNITPSSSVLNSLDAISTAKIYFELYRGAKQLNELSKAAIYRDYATSIRDTLKYKYPRITTSVGYNGFYHKLSYVKQMWLDGLYMGPAFYAEWQNSFGSSSDVDSWNDIALQFDTIFVHTWDKSKDLNYHAWAADPTTIGSNGASYWANQNTGCSSEFWGRGEGWLFAAIIDVLGYMPTNLSAYTRLKSYAQKIAYGLAARVDSSSGVWYQLLQYDNSKVGTSCNQENYLESSASSMFTYAYLKGIRLGVLDSAMYINMAVKAYKGLINEFVVENNGKISLKQSCTSAGLGQSRLGDADYYLCGEDVAINNNTEGKVLGPFIMASLEYEMLKERQKSNNNLTSVLNKKNNYLTYITFNGFELFNPKGYLINVFDISGDKVICSSKKNVSLNGLNKGIYILSVNGNSEKFELK